MEIACPRCGHLQKESRRAISTNCRGCGCYLKFTRPTLWQRWKHGAEVTVEAPSASGTPRLRKATHELQPSGDHSSGADGEADETGEDAQAAKATGSAPQKSAAATPAAAGDRACHFPMPESKIRVRLGLDGQKEAADNSSDDADDADDVDDEAGEPDASQETGDAGDVEESGREGTSDGDDEEEDDAPRGGRAKWLGPEERLKRSGRETTPWRLEHGGQQGDLDFPPRPSPLQRLRQKVLDQPSASAPKAPQSALRGLVENPAGGKSGQADDSTVANAKAASAVPDRADDLRRRITRDEETLVRGREKGHFRQGHFRDAVCFQCGTSHQTNRSAKETACPQCGSRIQLEDLEINSFHDELIRTRGSVRLQRNGHLNRGPVECQDLLLQGRVDCPVICSDDFQVAADAQIPKPVHCRRFLVDRRVEARALSAVKAVDARISGTFEGDLDCTGTVAIGAQGRVVGDVTARAVNLDPGGVIEGGMTILSGGSEESDGEHAAGS